MSDDFIPKQFQNPYDRLEELEIMVTAQGLALEQATNQIKDHADNFVKISEGLIQIANLMQFLKKQNISLQQQAQALHHRVKVLENKEHNNE